MGNNCYIKFSFINGNIYQRIEKLFNYIKEIKNEYIQIGNLDDDIKLLEFFSEEELNYFWWPTEQENNEFWDTYEKLPAKKKAEHLNSVPWDYAPVFDELVRKYGEDFNWSFIAFTNKNFIEEAK